MSNSIKTYFNNYQEMNESGDWLMHLGMRKSINQQFIDDNNLDGMVLFYEDVMQKHFSPEKLEKVHSLIRHLSLFENLEFLDRAVEDAADNNIVAVYVEYEGDNLDFFLTKEFDESDDFWASEYETCIDGYDISPLMEFFDWEFTTIEECVIADYVDAQILRKIVSFIRAKGLNKMFKFGFAEHDNPIVRF